MPSNVKNLEELLVLSDKQMSQLIPTASDPSNKKVKEELGESRIVTLSMKAHKYWKHRFPMEADLDDTVLKLKKILLVDLRTLAGFEMQDVPLERMVLHSHSTGVELLDHHLLRDFVVLDNQEIDLSIKE